MRGGLRGGGSQLQPAGELAGEQPERLAGAPGDRPGLRAQRSVPARADPGRTRCHPSMQSRSVCLGCCGQLGKEMAWQGGSGQLWTFLHSRWDIYDSGKRKLPIENKQRACCRLSEVILGSSI